MVEVAVPRVPRDEVEGHNVDHVNVEAELLEEPAEEGVELSTPASTSLDHDLVVQ